TTASFAVGVLLISRVRRFTRNFEAALFGNILGVTGTDLWVIAGVSVAALGLVLLYYKEFLYATFDQESARVFGVPTARAEALLALPLGCGGHAAAPVHRRPHAGRRDRPPRHHRTPPHRPVRPDAVGGHGHRGGDGRGRDVPELRPERSVRGDDRTDGSGR